MKPEEISVRIIGRMKEIGLKLTRQRLEIIDLLAREKTHPSAHDVFVKARKKAPTISLSTVWIFSREKD